MISDIECFAMKRWSQKMQKLDHIVKVTGYTVIIPIFESGYCYTCTYNDKLEKYISTKNWYCIRCYFLPVLFSIFFTCKQCCPFLNLPRKGCVLRKIVWDIEVCPVLNSTSDNEGKRGENESGTNISLYTVPGSL